MKRFCRKKSKNASQGDYFISLHILARRGERKNFTSPGASSGEKRRTSSTFSACFALNERIEIAIPSFHMNSCFNMKR